MEKYVNQEDILCAAMHLAPRLADQIGALRQTLSVIPVPHVDHLYPMLNALLRIHRTTNWLKELPASHWPTVTLLAFFLHALQAADVDTSDPDRAELRELLDKYPIYSAIARESHLPPSSVEAARAILVLCAWRWKESNSLRSIVDQFASAIRGMEFNRLVRDNFVPLAGAKSFEEACEVAARLTIPEHASLGRLWRDHVIPQLKQMTKSGGLPPETDQHDTDDRGEQPDRRIKKRRSASNLQRNRPDRIRLSDRTRPLTRSERAEAPDDNFPSEIFHSVPCASGKLADLRLAKFRAAQSIWTSNTLLLAEDIHSMGLRAGALLGRWLLREGLRAQQANNHRFARAAGRLTVMLATGKSLGALAAMRIAPNTARRATAGICSDTGKYTIEAFRPPDAFKPTTDESRWLAETSKQFSLELPDSVVEFLRALHSAGTVIESADPDEWKSDVRSACENAQIALGFEVLFGRVRRSLGCFLQHHGKDIAATMLICGDSFGLSTAPLYYYTPRVADLQLLYSKTLQTIFGGNARNLTPTATERIGSQLLLAEELRQKFSTSLGSKLQSRNARKRNLDSLVLTHNVLANHTIGMLLDTTGHRPVEELFKLSRTDFDLAGFGAIFRDKKVDAAHENRFVAIPRILRDQVAAYIDHLRSIAEMVSAETRAYVNQAVAGQMPLFFWLDDDGAPRIPSVHEWMDQAPSPWDKLPPNHARTTIATRARELGAPPEAISIQLGHLEAVGFPFSRDGATEAILFAEKMSPFLDQLARLGGWQLRSGYRSRQPENIWTTLGPLVDWTTRLAAEESKARQSERDEKIRRRAQIWNASASAEVNVLEVMRERYPILAQALRSPSTAKCPAETLNEDQVAALQEQLLQKTEGDPVAAIASMGALRRLLKRLKAATGWSGFTPPAWRSFRRVESTPFFPSMMLARSHIEALRDSFATIPALPPSTAEISVEIWKLAKACLAMCLFGFVDQPEQAVGILNQRSQMRRSNALPDLLLVAWNTSPRRVTGLRGLAAIAVSATTRLVTNAPLISTCPLLNQALYRMLPSGAVSSRIAVLEKLCSLVAVTNRIELSGASRLSLEASASADVDKQVAWLDGDPVSYAETPRQDRANLVEVGRPRVPARSRGYRRARDQYTSLLRIFPSDSTSTSLPRTDQTVCPTNAVNARGLVIAELKAWVSDASIHSTVAALAMWALKMFQQGTLQAKDPAYSTVKTYLTSVAKDLLPLLDSSLLTDLDDAELTQVYVELVELKRPGNRERTAREVLHFHEVVASHFGLADIDASELAVHLGDAYAASDSEIILPQEVEAVLDRMRSDAGNQTGHLDLETCRAMRQATVLLILQSRSGARVGEVLGLKNTDYKRTSEHAFINLRGNSNRRLKTKAARRQIDITHLIGEADSSFLSQWMDAESERFAVMSKKPIHVFSHLDSSQDLSPKVASRSLAIRALSAVTGRRTERSHRLRHGAANFGLAWFGLTSSDHERLPFLKSLAPSDSKTDDVAYPRDLYRHTAILGHQRPETSIRCYLHLNWVLRAKSDAWIYRRANRSLIASALSLSVYRCDQILRRHRKNVGQPDWLSRGVPARKRPDVHELATPSDLDGASVPANLAAAKGVARWLGWTERGVSVESSGLSTGAREAQIANVAAASGEYKARVGRDFLTRGNGVRKMSTSADLYKLFMLADGTNGDASILSEISAAHFAHARATDADKIRLPGREVKALSRLLIVCGIDPKLIEIVPSRDSDSIHILRVRRMAEQGGLFAGRQLKRILGVIWIRDRMRQLERGNTEEPHLLKRQQVEI